MLVLGCAEAPTLVPAEPSRVLESPSPALAVTCSEGTFTQFSAANGWDCNSTVEFHAINGSLGPYLTTAVGEWQARLSNTGFSDLPTFTTTNVPGNAEATVTGTHTGSAFCGHWNNGTRVLTVMSDTSCAPAYFDNSGPLPHLLLHEVGHAVGWSGSSVDKIVFATTAAEHCIMNLPLDGSLNTSICVHEIEGALAAYGLVSHDPSTFFTLPFVVGATSDLTSFTLDTDQTANLSPGNWRLEGGASVPGTGSSYFWTTSNDSVATVSGGTVTAVGPGTATIRAVPTSSSSYLLAHPFRSSGVWATVTVTVPAPAFMVTSDQTPIVTTGSHAFTAHLGTSSSTIYWRVDDSRTTTVDPDLTISTTGQVTDVSVDSGSYTLKFQVGLSPWPTGWDEWYLPSGWHEVHIPVCAEGGEENLSWSGKSGGGQTDAVASCPPPEQE